MLNNEKAFIVKESASGLQYRKYTTPTVNTKGQNLVGLRNLDSSKMAGLYELKSVDGKGLTAFAKQDIKRGTSIEKEEPSRGLNHSCRPNVRMWKLPKIAGDTEGPCEVSALNPEFGASENDQIICRATRKIKAGEELTFSYASIPFGLKNREFRQKFIKDNMNMICICDFCKVEPEDKDDIAAFEAFEKEEELLKMLIEESVGFKGPTVEDLNDFDKICQNTMDQIQCYKNIYNLGKKKHVCWNYLYEYVLLKGVEVPISTIRSAFSSKQILAFLKADGFHLLEEVEKLFKAAKAMDDSLGATKEERSIWQALHDAFERMTSTINKMYMALVAANPSFSQLKR